MTDAVKGVTAQPYEDGKYRRSRLDREKARALKTDAKARSLFKEEKAKEYKQEIPELTQRQANAFGKKTMQNERTAAVVDDTIVYIDKAKYNAAKANDKEHNHVYIPENDNFWGKLDFKNNNKEVRKMIAENPEDFYVNGEFSSDQFKRRIGGFTGFDNKGNLDEIATMSADYDIAKKSARQAMKYAGYEREKDLTVLYKTLAGLGVLGASTGTGALLGNKFTSNVFGIHNDGSTELLDTIITTSNSTKIGALKGLIAGILPAAVAAYLVKDNGYADIFKGNTAEEIVAKGERNIESRIKGEKNQKMMKAILKMENLSNEDKAIILKLAYGELTGKKVNDRELVAAYEIAKYCNAHPEVKAQDYDKLPGTTTPPVNNNDENHQNNGENNNSNIDNNQNNGGNNESNLCELNVIGNNDGVKTHQYKVIYGDNPYGVTQGLYRRADGKPMTHKEILALRYDLFGKNRGFNKLGNIELPDSRTVNGVEYVYREGKVVQGSTKNPKAFQPYQQATYPGETFRIEEGCGNTVIQNNIANRETANQQAEHLAKENPEKYIFIK